VCKWRTTNHHHHHHRHRIAYLKIKLNFGDITALSYYCNVFDYEHFEDGGKNFQVSFIHKLAFVAAACVTRCCASAAGHLCYGAGAHQCMSTLSPVQLVFL